ncbi:glycosyltransferase family 61 protein [Nocardioides sp. cx-169]|uniref:glycosyltransferase family 61 protein n=1 Tax=Nocardioides sp. cx-169 TaxID=2899080 RepID=UPI001E2B1140|nr:glycosyltransferase 61 family protein [Nocardioides sp. cx-169]MCD4536516.1 glycosyltransferase family 61 protein [Nocardioides sp. cx-169]
MDLILNTRPASAKTHLAQMNGLMPHAAVGGVYAADTRSIEPSADSFITALANLTPHGRLPPAQRQRAALVSSVISGPLVAGVVIGREALLKTRHATATEVINRRPGRTHVTELQVLPRGAFHDPARLWTHSVRGIEEVRIADSFPEHQLRHYQSGDITLAYGSIAFADGVLFPDTFRWHLQKRLTNSRLIDIGPHFGRIKGAQKSTQLAGSYYHFDYPNPGHYGHLMTEGISRLWGWEAAKTAIPDLKLLRRIHPRDITSGREPHDVELLTAFGIAPDDIVRVAGRVTINSLVAATPMWHNQVPFYVHPSMTSIWEQLGRGFGTQGLEATERIFVTRSKSGGRVCKNTSEVELLFAAAGFRIVHPGGMTLTEQAGLFARARVVAGFAGTGMFNLAYAHRVERVIVLTQDAYDARNEYLFATPRGAETHYFLSSADVAHPPDGWSYEAFQSSWTFDIKRHQANLLELIRH